MNSTKLPTPEGQDLVPSQSGVEHNVPRHESNVHTGVVVVRPLNFRCCNLELHSSLHKCSVCGTYWEHTDRYADVIAKSKAKMLYPKGFETG
jgi:hypothetical protein